MKIKLLTIVVTIAVVAGLSTALSACQAFRAPEISEKFVSGSGNVVTEPRDVSGFTAVSLEGIGQLVIQRAV